jgi:hypothetical protein
LAECNGGYTVKILSLSSTLSALAKAFYPNFYLVSSFLVVTHVTVIDAKVLVLKNNVPVPSPAVRVDLQERDRFIQTRRERAATVVI